MKTSIVVAGASGYIGRGILPLLLEKFPNAEITALSRSAQASENPSISWKACDLFSLRSLEDALPPRVDLAYYLVHSMGPTAQLDQGSFADYDLILADNFSRALKGKGVSQLIYLGGLIPENVKLSLHLQSRLEVEDTFREHGLPTTTFRAGLILGETGSSSQILTKLVRRLPVMICPAWTQTLTTPIDLQSVLDALCKAALDPGMVNRVFDLAGCLPLTYLQMMRKTAHHLGKKRWFLSVPFFTPTLSRLWVSLITNSPKNLVYPLVESLKHPMVARPSHCFGSPPTKDYASLLEDVSLAKTVRRPTFHFRPVGRTVRSVQRMGLPEGKNALWVKDRYVEWLPKFFAPLIRVKVEGPRIAFSALFSKPVLLELRLSEERSNPDRQLLYIIRGLLVRRKERGRLEFRVVLGRRFVLAAIHDFSPALPWFVYKLTQAKLHIIVMRVFGRSLAKCIE